MGMTDWGLVAGELGVAAGVEGSHISGLEGLGSERRRDGVGRDFRFRPPVAWSSSRRTADLRRVAARTQKALSLEGQRPIRRACTPTDLADRRSSSVPIHRRRDRPGIDSDRAHTAGCGRRLWFRGSHRGATGGVRDRGDLDGKFVEVVGYLSRGRSLGRTLGMEFSFGVVGVVGVESGEH